MAVFAVDSALSLMNSIIHVRPEVASLREQQSAPPPALEPPADLDAMLDELDSILARFDGLTGKERNFPAELAAIEAKRDALTNQELESFGRGVQTFCDARTSRNAAKEGKKSN